MLCRASPPSEIEFIQDAVQLIYESVADETMEITTTADIQRHLSTEYDTQCRIFKHYWNEVVSLIEQALIEKSGDFYYWPLSTWSERIMDLRMYKNPESPRYFDIIEEIVTTKISKN